MRKTIFIILITVLIFNIFLTFNTVYAQEGASSKALSGLKSTAQNAGLGKGEPKDPAFYIGRALEVLLSILGIIFLIITIYGGMTWMTAAGTPDNVKKGRNMIIEGVFGLIVCVGAYALTYYVVEKVTGAVGI